MKKRAAALVLTALAIALAVVAYVTLSRPGEAPRSTGPKAFKCVRTVSVYAALIENPTAARALLVGSFKDSYREILANAGLVCETSPQGEFDVVFVAGEASRRELSAARKALAPDGVWAECIDVREMKASALKKRLEALPYECVHVWMPGEKDWVLAGRRASARPRLEDMMDLFAREGAFADLAAAQCNTLPVAFASYAGSREDMAAAFAGEDGPVEPENFVTREVAPLDWIDAGAVDADIRDGALREMRSMQIVRRIVLVGDMQAGRHDEEKSAEVWARAALRNPGDTILVERMERLSVNAQAFLKLGKAAMAARCYDTMAQVLPSDPMPVYNYGLCMQQLGETELAELAFERARELSGTTSEEKSK